MKVTDRATLERWIKRHDPRSVLSILRLPAEHVTAVASIPCPTEKEDKVITASKRLRLLVRLKEKDTCEVCPNRDSCKVRDVKLKEQPSKHAIGNFPGCNTTLGDLLLVLSQLHLRANQS